MPPVVVFFVCLSLGRLLAGGDEGESGRPWRSLSLVKDGRVDAGWAQIGWGSFVVEDGALRTECDQKGMGLLLYRKEKLGDCQIRVVYRSKDPRSNAGVFVRIDDGILERIDDKPAPAERDTRGRLTEGSLERFMEASEKEQGPWYAVHHGYEVQICDDSDEYHRTGAVYSLARALPAPERKAADWRTMVITLQGELVLVDIDGKRTTTFDPRKELPTERKWFEPRREPKRPRSGYLGLQNHDPGDVVYFKEVSVRPLEDRPSTGGGAAGLPAKETALDRYVAKPDPTYSFKVESETEKEGLHEFVVALKSQTWRTPEEVDRTVWEHWLVIVKPAKAAPGTAFLFIGGGRNRPEPPAGAEELVQRIARETNTVAAELRMVPNQPLVFGGDGVKRSEDDLIAYTWDKFLKTGDETWPARLPMVKSAVRAMDCVQEVLRSERGGRLLIEKFVVAGGSKRGWTTWCTAAVDRRVTAAIPIVIDVLNVRASMRHHVGVYGFYSAAVGDYHRHGLMQRQDDARLDALYEIEDPFSYRDRLTMPKFVVNSSGDEFFCPDSSQFYWNELPGEKVLRYVPNAPHSLRNSDAGESISAFYQMVLSGRARPTYSWTFEKDGSIRVTAKEKPRAARLWQATNPERRDFRYLALGPAYTERPLAPEKDGSYLARVEAPAKGWTAFFVELDFDSGGGSPLKLTTAVRVLPDSLPHAGLDPARAPLEQIPKR